MYLDHVHLRNIGPFHDTRVPLGPVTVLVGKNGTGKSTVLHAIARYRDAGWRQEASGERTPHVTFQFADSADTRSFGYYGDESPAMFNGEVRETDKVSQSYEDFFSACRLYDMREGRIASSMDIGLSGKLDPDFRNMVSVIDRIRDVDPSAFGRLNEFATRLVPGLRSIGVRPVGHHKKQVSAVLSDGTPVPFHLLSTGTQYLVAMAAVLARQASARCMLLEEPETGLHPSVIGELVDALAGLVTGPDPLCEQLIFTTHSPWVYTRFRATPSAIVVLENKNDELQAKRVSDMEDWELLFTDEDMLGRAMLPPTLLP